MECEPYQSKAGRLSPVQPVQRAGSGRLRVEAQHSSVFATFIGSSLHLCCAGKQANCPAGQQRRGGGASSPHILARRLCAYALAHDITCMMHGLHTQQAETGQCRLAGVGLCRLQQMLGPTCRH